MNNNDYSIAALSFLGDAVYELEIRNYLVSSGIKDGDQLHRECTKYVRAEAQAKIIKALMTERETHIGEGSRDVLSAEEVAIVKRARNHKFANRSRSANPVEYRLATGLEALMGHLYVTDSRERLKELVEEAIRIIGGNDE